MGLDGKLLWQRKFAIDGGRPAGCGFSDVTGDGRPEIITRANDEGHQDVVIYDNTGEILGRTRVGFTVEGFGPYFYDFDGDGKDEMAVFGQDGRKAVVRFYDISLVPTSNLALKLLLPSKITASSSDPGSPVANLADGNPATYWASSGNAYPAWIQVDLGAVSSVRKTVAKFYEEGDSRYYGYTIEASEDGVQYVTLTDDSANTVIGKVTDAFDGVYARYIRLKLINCNRSGGWPSLFEFEVWGQRNLALGRSIFANGSDPVKPPQRAVDGSHTTDWASAVNQFPQWIRVDMGGGKAISGLRTDFYQEGDGRYYRYRVESSQDNSNFALLADKGSNTTVGKVEDTFKDAYGRHVRIDLDGCSRPGGGGCWPSLNEMEVFGTSNLAVSTLPIVSSDYQVGNEASHAMDGDITTRWSAQYFPQWIQVDLGVTRSIGRTEVLPLYGRAYRYEILGSMDGTTFSSIVDRTSNTLGGSILADTFAPVRARYVRLKVTGCFGDPTGWASINELRVFGD
jgi:hypothetical protein